MAYERNPEKNEKLLEERGIGFDDIVAALDNIENILYHGPHKNQVLYPHQYMFLVLVGGYPQLVPYVRTKENNIFLKTIYPYNRQK